MPVITPNITGQSGVSAMQPAPAGGAPTGANPLMDAVPPIRPDEMLRKLQIAAGLQPPEVAPPERKRATELAAQGLTLLLQAAQTDLTIGSVISEIVPELARKIFRAATPTLQPEPSLLMEDFYGPEEGEPAMPPMNREENMGGMMDMMR